jgi:hypothetical protein
MVFFELNIISDSIVTVRKGQNYATLTNTLAYLSRAKRTQAEHLTMPVSLGRVRDILDQRSLPKVVKLFTIVNYEVL